MKWLSLKPDEAREKYEYYCSSLTVEVDPAYEEMRQDICSSFEKALEEIESREDEHGTRNSSYMLDLKFGLKLYSTLNNKYGMNIRTASDEGIWRYLCVCVFPDLIVKRYGLDHPDRFWKKPKRLWLRVIWWYIYLSWQGSEKETYEVLKNNSTDEILQLVDRCGRGGYRVSLYREMMKKYSEIPPEERTRQVFRKTMVLNTARVQTVEPELSEGGTRGYVDGLYDYFR